jgi:DNA-binding response OmpR family regulator
VKGFASAASLLIINTSVRNISHTKPDYLLHTERETILTQSSTQHRILVVDDEQTIREVVRRYLEHDGFSVIEAADGQSVLDLMLPGIDGWTLTNQLRAAGRNIPIVMLTARGETRDRIYGLDLGADDYITKPFSPQELVSRVRAVLRRTASDEPAIESTPQPITFPRLTIDPVSHTVEVDGSAVDLTSREFDLLYFLASHPAQVFTREQILDHVWGYDFYGDPATVTVHIRRLREKIEPNPSEPIHLVTVWGVGYRFEKDIK